MAFEDCIQDLVGVTEKDCPCWSTGKPKDLNKSISGFYADDYEYGVPILTPTQDDCGGGFWAALPSIKKSAARSFATYLIKGISDNKNEFIDGFGGYFGEENLKNGNAPDYNATGRFVGHSINPSKYKGVTLYLDRIGIGIDKADTYEVFVYDENRDKVFDEPLQIEHPGGNAYKTVAVSLKLPLMVGGKKKQYFLAYDRKDGTPLNYTYYCGCGESYKPQWMQNGFVTSKGFQTDDLNNLNINKCNRDYTGGIIVSWQMICDPTEWLCNVHIDFWKNSPWGKVAAQAFQMQFSLKIIAYQLEHSDFNSTLLSNEEMLYRKRSKIKKVYDDLMLGYLTIKLPNDASDCWKCVEEFIMTRNENIV